MARDPENRYYAVLTAGVQSKEELEEVNTLHRLIDMGASPERDRLLTTSGPSGIPHSGTKSAWAELARAG